MLDRQAGAADGLSAESVAESLGTTVVGYRVVYRPETASTNDLARSLARECAVDGTLVLTDHQTAGRGRLDRQWQAPPGSSLLLSILFRPALLPANVHHLTMICGLALVSAIESETGLQAGLKWPNDVVYGERKLAGILTEAELGGAAIDYAIVGVGVNVNLDPRQLGRPLHAPATSLSQALGRPVPRLPLLRAFLRAADQRYLRLSGGWSPHEDWARRLITLRKRVTVTSFGETASGVAEAVNEQGHLILRLPDGSVEVIVAGDVALAGEVAPPGLRPDEHPDVEREIV